jgi:hypothetical protein
MGLMETMPAAAASAQPHVREFEQQGYTVARRMFSGDDMGEFIDEIKSFEQRGSDRAEPNSKGRMQFYSELFRRSARVRSFLTQQRLVDFIAPIAGPNLWIRWDQAVAKHPGSGVFPWHTDQGYDLLPQHHFEIWIALSQSRKDNGGLCVIPGSHRQRFSHHREGTHMVANGSARYDSDARRVWVEADVGDVIVFSSLLLHKTYENVASDARWAYVAEVLKLGDFDPTIAPPYFVLARSGKAVGAFERALACARDPWQRAITLTLALRHKVAGPLVRKLKSVLRPAAAN